MAASFLPKVVLPLPLLPTTLIFFMEGSEDIGWLRIGR
jgi:hypothetical protein